MKKKLTFVCVLMLALLACTGALAEMVSIAELHDQAEAMGGRWQKSYETPKGTLEVNAPIIVPDVEAMPVITVERAKPLTQELFDEIAADKRTSRTQKEILYVSDVDGQEKEYFLGYEENGVGGYEMVDRANMQVGKYRIDQTDGYCGIGAVEPQTYHFSWELNPDEQYVRDSGMTVDGAMELLRGEIKNLYPNMEIDVRANIVEIKGSLLTENTGKGKLWSEPGDMYVSAEQYLNGLPVIGSIATQAGPGFCTSYTATRETTKKSDALYAYRAGARASEPSFSVTGQDEKNYLIRTEAAKVRTVEFVDVPLTSLDQVIEALEKEIVTGKIQQIYSLRLGYLLYSDSEMTDHAWAIPRWVMDCRYGSKEEIGMARDVTDYMWAHMDYYRMPIDAQSGEPIIFSIGDEKTFSVPKMTTWDDVN